MNKLQELIYMFDYVCRIDVVLDLPSSKNSAVAVGVLIGTISVWNHEGNPSFLQKLKLWQECLLQTIHSEVILCIFEEASNPLFNISVLLFPGVGRGNDKDSFLCQHGLK